MAGLPRDFINDIEVLHIEDYERTNPYCRNRRSQRDQKPERISKRQKFGVSSSIMEPINLKLVVSFTEIEKKFRETV